MPGKREGCISWDTYFMLMPLLAKDRSKDPRTQVGAVIVKKNYILSTGYNGTPVGMSDDEMPWDSLGEETGDFLTTKNAFVVHAEANAIMHYRGPKDDLKGSTMYATLFPCNECAKLITSSGISEVVYLSMYKYSDKTEATMKMFEKANVRFRQMNDVTEMISECQDLIDYLTSLKTGEPFVRKMRPKCKQ